MLVRSFHFNKDGLSLTHIVGLIAMLVQFAITYQTLAHLHSCHCKL